MSGYGRTNVGKSCSVEDCAKPARTRGWCSMHYERWRVTNTKTVPKTPEPCSIEGCDKPTDARGWCGMHWQRWRKHGDPLALKEPTPVIEKIKARVTVDADSGCWIWGGKIDPNGYGRCYNPATQAEGLAHRVAYVAAVGRIPEGLTLDHLCRETRCVNPDHLEPVTLAENIKRAAQTRTHCPKGHPFDEANTGKGYRGSRRCLTCHREGQREYMKRRRNSAA